MGICDSIINGINVINHFVCYLVDIFFYIVSKLLRLGKKRYPYKDRVAGNRKLTILANGPSLRKVLENYKENDLFDNSDYVVMNYFAHENVFRELKPKYYCLADPMFLIKDSRYEKVMALFKVLNEEVDWDMDLYIVFNKKKFLRFSGLNNPHIHICSINVSKFMGFGSFAHLLYRHNFAAPIMGTVANLCVYIGLNNGYKTINLFGVDMSFFEGICVDENNQLCSIIRHFYDDKTELRPYIDQQTNQAMKLSKYIDMVNLMIKSHEVLASYALSLGANVVNRTENSMLDCYPRS